MILLYKSFELGSGKSMISISILLAEKNPAERERTQSKHFTELKLQIVQVTKPNMDVRQNKAAQFTLNLSKNAV